MSEFFDRLSEALTSTGKNVGDKAKAKSDEVKLLYKVGTEKKALEMIYTEIGKAYYEAYKDEPVEEVAALVSEATIKAAEIAAIEDQIRTIKGVYVCPNCGADIPLEYDFCGKCGTKAERPEPAPVAEAEAEVKEDTVDIKVEVDPDEPSTNN
ncbi:MAG: zinc ribbon domain-containing protein [Oscillospiraceae bacterium]|nr:zinc ribbon domain-containing protein [Oscillospiraceae bacterium]